jgi:hypothetical protein
MKKQYRLSYPKCKKRDLTPIPDPSCCLLKLLDKAPHR